MSPLRLISGGKVPDPDIDIEQAFQMAPIGLAIFDRELRFMRCNDRLADINGMPVEEHLGESLFNLLPGIAADIGPDFLRVFETCEPFMDRVVRGKTPAGPDDDRVWLEGAKPLPANSGSTEYILVSVKEITDLDRAQRAIQDSEEQFRISQELSPDAYTVFRAIREADGKVVDFLYEYANPAAVAMGGQELIGRRLLHAFPGNGKHPLLFDRYVRLLAEQGTDIVEVQYEDDTVCGWYRNSAIAIDKERLAVSYRDITQRKALEEKLKLVVHEYRHRLKNAFAVMSALTKQSARSATSVQSLSDDVCGRLMAMATAQDLLSQDTGTASLPRLVTDILAPFEGAALDIDGGPGVQVSQEGAMALALALNELATNAVKYGGLRSGAGGVTVHWEKAERRVTLHWCERGCCLPEGPPREGFGTRLIKDVERRLPQGKLQRSFGGGGLTAKLSFAVE